MIFLEEKSSPSPLIDLTSKSHESFSLYIIIFFHVFLIHNLSTCILTKIFKFHKKKERTNLLLSKPSNLINHETKHELPSLSKRKEKEMAGPKNFPEPSEREKKGIQFGKSRETVCTTLAVLIASVNKLYQPGRGQPPPFSLPLVNKNARPAGGS